MSKQIAGGPEAETKQCHRAGKVKRLAMIHNILMALEFLFGCWHRNLSRPFTLSGWTYEVCLNCGRKFAYNRAEIGYGLPKRKKGDPRGTAWQEDYTTVSLLSELQQERIRST